MINLSRLNSLPDQIKSLICVAVLIDGKDSIDFLQDNPVLTNYLDIVTELSKVSPDVRVPVIGTILRQSLSSKGSK